MKFSVTIPCFSPDPKQLQHCLTSICSQLDLSKDEVIVVDDCSPDESLCRVVVNACRGVRLVRTASQVWGCGAANLGYSLSTGELLHVCHPDDYVLQGFYSAVGATAEQVPDVALYATDHLECDEQGRAFSAPSIDWPNSIQRIHDGNPLAVAACVVRRAFVEQHGGWDADLTHTADWLLFHKAAVLGGACRIQSPSAAYCHSPKNHTGRLKRDASNLRDYLRMADKVATYAEVDRLKFEAYVLMRAKRQAEAFRRQGDVEAAEANEAFVKELEVAS